MDQKVLDIVNLKVLPEFPQEEKQLGILVILEIASALVTLFQCCPDILSKLEQDSEKVLNMLRHPNLFNKARLYLAVRRQCKKAGTLDQLHTIVDAIVKAGKSATKEDVTAICLAANAQKTQLGDII